MVVFVGKIQKEKNIAIVPTVNLEVLIVFIQDVSGVQIIKNARMVESQLDMR